MASSGRGDWESVELFNRRVKAITMSMTYQDWLESFKDPFTYDPEKFLDLELENDFILYFGSNPGGRTLKVPVAFLCTISKPLHAIIANYHRHSRKAPVFDKSEVFFFWWLKNFLRNTCLMPNAAGVAALLTKAHKYDIQPIEHISRMYLYTMVNLDSFPHVLNAALDTDDEEFLAQCSCMVAAWSDELLSSPHISVLSCRAMVYLLDNANLSPSSELMVFNAVANWARTKGWNDFPTEIAYCLQKVRYLLFAEDEFQQEVLPTGMFPIQDANMMMRLIRDEPGYEHHPVSLVHDPRLQGTPRPVLRRTLVLGKEVPEKEDSFFTYESTRRMYEHPVCFFRVDKHVLLRRVSSPSFVDEEGGRLRLEERDGFRVKNKWIHCSSTFEKPLPLQPNRSYQLVFSSDTGRAEREICHTFEEAVGYVTFKGMLFCSHLSLEFATFQAADAETIDKVWAFLRPTDIEEVIVHKETTLERLFRYEELEEENRRDLQAAREKQELEDMYKEAFEERKIALPDLELPSIKVCDNCEARRNHDNVTAEKSSEDLTVVIGDSGSILEIRAIETEPDSAAADNGAERNGDSGASVKEPEKVAAINESRRNGNNGISETEVERAAAGNESETEVERAAAGNESETEVERAAATNESETEVERAAATNESETVERAAATNERGDAYNEAPGTEPESEAAENGVRTNGNNNEIGTEPENADSENGVRTNGNNNEIGTEPESATAENGGRNGDTGAFRAEPESAAGESEGRTNGDNGTSRAETDRAAAENEASRKRDSGASYASSEDSIEVIGDSDIYEIIPNNDGARNKPNSTGGEKDAGRSAANGASVTEPKAMKSLEDELAEAMEEDHF